MHTKTPIPPPPPHCARGTRNTIERKFFCGKTIIIFDLEIYARARRVADTTNTNDNALTSNGGQTLTRVPQ